MKHDRLLAIIPIALFFAFVTTPMLTLSRDMWDGTIIEYASLIRDFSGLWSYFIESTWFLQYPLSLAVINFSDILGISYKNANAVFVFVFILILLRETFLFGRDQIKLPNKTAYFAISLLATSSVWGDLLSSIMTLHLGCMALGLLSVRAIHTGSSSIKFAGFAGLVMSLNLQSQLVYLPVLSYIYDLSKANKDKNTWLIRPSFKTIQIFFIGFILYAIVRIFFPPHGQYVNYNSPILGSLLGLAKAGYSFLLFGTYLAPIVASVFIIAVLTDSSYNHQKNIFITKLSLNPKWLVWLMILFLAGAFPYAVVGKTSTLWGVTDWKNRQAFLLAVPTALLTASYLQIMYEKAAVSLIKNTVLICGAVILLLNAFLLLSATAYKVNRQIFVSQLEAEIKINEEKLQPGLLEIVGDGIPGPSLRGYESNFLMFTATGKADWWTRVSTDRDRNFFTPCFIQQKQAYQIKYIYNYDESHDKNYTSMKIKVHGFKGPINIFRNILGIGPGGKIEIISVSQEFNKHPKEHPKCD